MEQSPAEPSGATDTTDVVVLGLGVGGEAVAGALAEAGLSVVGVENRLIGGECPYYGCVPTKMMVRAAGLITDGHRIPGVAGTAMVEPNWKPVARRIRDEATDDWDDTVAADRLVGKGVRLVRGSGRLAGPGAVVVAPASDGAAGNGRELVLHARLGVVVATGTRPFVPPIPGLAGTPYWTNQDAVRTDVVPESLVVLGGGGIGVELAQVFARFDSRVTVVEGGPRLIAREEPESSALLAKTFAREGIEVRTGVSATRVDHDGDTFTVSLSDGRNVTGAALLVAVGRRSDLGSIGAGTIGVEPSAHALPVDGQLRVTAEDAPGPAVWALGDITGKGVFTHMAMYHAGIVTRAVLAAAGRGEAGPDAEYAAVSRVTFTDPEIGAVGLTEEQARELGYDVRIGRSDLGASTRGWIHQAEGFVKLVADATTGTLLGGSVGGPYGGEVMSALAVAVHGRVPLERLRHMIYAYPTFWRAIEAAVLDVG